MVLGHVSHHKCWWNSLVAVLTLVIEGGRVGSRVVVTGCGRRRQRWLVLVVARRREGKHSVHVVSVLTKLVASLEHRPARVASERELSFAFLDRSVDVGNDSFVLVDHDPVHLEHVSSQEVLVAHLLVADVTVVLSVRWVLSLHTLSFVGLKTQKMIKILLVSWFYRREGREWLEVLHSSKLLMKWWLEGKWEWRKCLWE